MKRHTLFIYTAALLTMLSTALPMSAQNKSFTVNRNDCASQKYSYSQGDRLVLSREDSQGKKHADFVEQQVYVGNDVHNFPLTSIESITFDTQATEDEGKTFTVQESGGKIEYDDITIDFPSGTFKGDAKAVVGEAEKGSVDGACELSKCYNLELNADAYKDFKVAIKMAKASNDDQVKMMVVTPGWSISLNEDGKTHNLFDVQYSDGAYVANIDAFGLPEGNNNVKVSFGLTSYTPENSYTRTRIETPKGFTVHPMNSNNDIYIQIKYDYIPAALSYIKALGFEKEEGIIEYYIEPLSSNQARGVYFGSRMAALGETGKPWRYGTISINKNKVDKMEYADEPDLLQKALIHETFHLYQQRYGGLNSNSHNTGTILDEATAIWIERFVGGSRKIDLSDSPGKQNCYMFLSSLNPEHKDLTGNGVTSGATWGDRYQNVGYGMSTLVEYLSQKLGDGVVKSMYLEKKGSSSPNNTIGIVEKIAKGGKDGKGKDGINIFTQDEYFKFVEALGTGKVYPGEFDFDMLFNEAGRIEKYMNGTTYGTIKQTMTSNDPITFHNIAYEYGALIEKLTVDGMRFTDRINGLDKKDCIVSQKKSGVKTWVFGTENNSIVLIGSAWYENPITIPHKFFPKINPNNEESAYKTVDFYLVTIPDDFTKEAESENYVSFYQDVRLSISPNDPLEFETEGGTKTLTVKTNQPSFTYEKDKDWPDWLKVEINKDDFTMEVTAEPNTSAERKATITVYALDAKGNKVGLPEEVEVTQKGKGGSTIREKLEMILESEYIYWVGIGFRATCSYSYQETGKKSEQREEYYRGDIVPQYLSAKDMMSISFNGNSAIVVVNGSFHSLNMTIDNIDSDKGIITSLNYHYKHETSSTSSNQLDERILKASNIPFLDYNEFYGEKQDGTVLDQFKTVNYRKSEDYIFNAEYLWGGKPDYTIYVYFGMNPITIDPNNPWDD